ncbi:hypothetical protein Ancab_025935 [Ancistrocladus abbreviatus]
MSKTTQFEDYDHSEDDEEELQGVGAEEEEALSLSDLPLITTIHEDHHHQPKSEPIKSPEEKEEEEDFDFGSLIGPIEAFDSEMCAADEVFFGGQILPFRHSISSDTGFRNHSSNSLSRSESMDRGSASRLRSASLTSSRSSSTKSHYSSSSSTCTSSSSSSNTNSARKPKILNHFHSHPSPKPQIWASSTRSGPNSAPSRKSSSSLWEFLRLGLVRAPEIELTDLKARTRRFSYTKSGPIISRSSSNSSNNGNLRGKCTADNFVNSNDDDLNAKKEQKSNEGSKRRFYEKNGGIFNGCRCSVLAVEPIPTTRVIVANGGKGAVINEDDKERSEEKQQQRQRQRQRGQAASRSRTFEWLKDLSHTGVLNPVV